MAIGGTPQVEEINARGVEPVIIIDPGDGGTIDTSHSGYCELTTAGAETRTLGDPVYKGQQIDLVMIVRVGDCVITSDSPVNQAGHTTLTFSAVGGFLRLVGKYNATDGWEWQEVFEDTGSATT